MWLDDLIGYISPKAGSERYAARLAMEALRKRDYDGADKGRRRDGWRARGTSANTEIGRAGPLLRARATDLVRNNPYAKKGKRAYVTHAIGTGIKARPDTGSDRVNRLLTEIWDEWSAGCYGPARLNFGGVQGLVAGTRFVTGECLIRFVQTPATDGRRVPLQLQVLEPDHLDTTRTAPGEPANRVVQGIEYDTLERPVAYWLFPEHPGEALSLRPRRTTQSVRVPAADVLHVYRVDRPGQSRGVTEFDAAIGKLRDLDDYDNAEIVRKQIAACLAAFVKTADGNPLGTQSAEAATGAILEKLRPGMIGYLKPGEDVTVATPPRDTGAGEFDRRLLYAIASGLGITYEQLTSDLRQVNYSSYRAGLIDFRAMVEDDRWNVYVPMLCQPVWARVMKTASIAGLVKKPYYPVEWVPQAFQSVDPKKDADADEKMLRIGTKTLRQAIAEQGYNPDEQLEQIAETNQKLDELGIVSDADPRKVGRNGSAPAADPATQPTQEAANAQV